MQHYIISSNFKTPELMTNIYIDGIVQRIEIPLYWACYDWITTPCWKTFWGVYFGAFHYSANPIFRVYKIITNTKSGRYKDIVLGYDKYIKYVQNNHKN